jgi:hypothetical protein
VIHVLTAVITAKGENSMTPNTETTVDPAPPAEASSAAKKARVGARRANVALPKAKSAKKPSPVAKPPKSGKKASGARDGSKSAKVLELLKWPGGVTAKELVKVTGWQPHSVRGFLSGTVGKMVLAVTSTKAEDWGVQLRRKSLIRSSDVHIAPPGFRPPATLDSGSLLETFRRDLTKRPAVSLQDGLLAGVLLIASNDAICVLRIDLHQTCSAIATFASDQG